MRKIIASIATSADGYIARPDGSVDWLNRIPPAGDYGMGAFHRSIDTILWGRKTYEAALEFQEQGIKGAEFDLRVRNYVFSHQFVVPVFIGDGIRLIAPRHREVPLRLHSVRS